MNRRHEPHGPALLITGGSGFVGRALVRELIGPDPVIEASEIRIYDLHEPVDFPDDRRIRFVRGDIRDSSALDTAAAGIDAVIHLAAMVDWGTHPASTVYSINAGGTVNALHAARNAGVGAFVHSSSLDAVITGRNLRDIDESFPYPRRAPNAYCGSKAESEKAVAAFDKRDGLRTVSLRPSSVWGEADPYHISALIRQALHGPYARIGDGSALQQLVYVGNLAHAFLLACRELLGGRRERRSPACAGKVYFITDAPPENFFRFFDRIVEDSGYPIRPENLWIPRDLMMAAGIAAETIARLIRPIHRWNPKVSRFAVNYTCSDFTYRSTAAERDFAFTPRYSGAQAHENTVSWFRTHEPVMPPVIPEI